MCRKVDRTKHTRKFRVSIVWFLTVPIWYPAVTRVYHNTVTVLSYLQTQELAQCCVEAVSTDDGEWYDAVAGSIL